MYSGSMTTYKDHFYPEKTFTIDDAVVRDETSYPNTAYHAAHFEANGKIGKESFSFYLNNGMLSFDISDLFGVTLDVNEDKYGNLVSDCSHEQFVSLFNEVIAGYKPLKTPVTSVEGAVYSFDDVVISHNDIANGGTLKGEIPGAFPTNFTLEVRNRIAYLECDNGYSRQVRTFHAHHPILWGALPEDVIEEFFNILIADYS